MHPEQKRSFQNMTPETKLKLLNDLQRSARKLKAAGLRKQNPNWTEEEIKQKVREIFLYARS
jgi:hypothetical protein